MIRACIFDLGGTIVDRYSLTPFLSLQKIFSDKHVNISNRLIFKDMGKSKREHITDIINNKSVKYQWERIYKRKPQEYDIDTLFREFNKIQTNYCSTLMTILPETRECIEYLQYNKILTGATTGFNEQNMHIIRKKLEFQNLHLNSYVSSTCLDTQSRPYPYMIQENMNRLNIRNPRSVIKIDDTAIGIQEGQNANCWTVGVVRWSSNMKIQTIEEAYNLELYQLQENFKKCKQTLIATGADYVIDSLDDLPNVIRDINMRS